MKSNSPGTILVSEAALKELWPAVLEFEIAKRKAEALFYLLHTQFEQSREEGTMEEGRHGQLSAGIMDLCAGVVMDLDASYDATATAARAVKAIASNTRKEGAR